MDFDKKKVKVVSSPQADSRVLTEDNDPLEEWLDYDVLVFAVGARNNTFGIPGVKSHVHFLKELTDARAIRQHVIK